MAEPELIDYLFSNLSDYLKKIKVPLYDIQNYPSNDADTINLLQQNKAVLEEIKRKCESYKDDANSTIQHINDILAQQTGGKKYKRKTRKRRHSRKSRSHN